MDVGKYHETITRAWIMAVHHFMTLSPSHESAASFMAANPELLDSRIMLTHYSAAVLFSPEARAVVRSARHPVDSAACKVVIQRIAADAVVLVHLAFIAFVALGALLAARWRWVPWLHIPALLWGVLVETTGRLCPLTDLENALRTRAGQSGYPRRLHRTLRARDHLPRQVSPARSSSRSHWV